MERIKTGSLLPVWLAGPSSLGAFPIPNGCDLYSYFIISIYTGEESNTGYRGSRRHTKTATICVHYLPDHCTDSFKSSCSSPMQLCWSIYSNYTYKEDGQFKVTRFIQLKTYLSS